MAAAVTLSGQPNSADRATAAYRNPLDEALAKLCEASAEAVEEMEDVGWDGCPLCGKPSSAHPREGDRVLD